MRIREAPKPPPPSNSLPASRTHSTWSSCSQVRRWGRWRSGVPRPPRPICSTGPSRWRPRRHRGLRRRDRRRLGDRRHRSAIDGVAAPPRRSCACRGGRQCPHRGRGQRGGAGHHGLGRRRRRGDAVLVRGRNGVMPSPTSSPATSPLPASCRPRCRSASRTSPVYTNYPGERGQVRYGEGVFVGYRWYDARRVDPRGSFRARPVVHDLCARPAAGFGHRGARQTNSWLVIGSASSSRSGTRAPDAARKWCSVTSTTRVRRWPDLPKS